MHFIFVTARWLKCTYVSGFKCSPGSALVPVNTTHMLKAKRCKMAKKQSTNDKKSSRDLLQFGNGGGIHDKLLLKSKKATLLQTEKIPRSSVLDRLQSFLPQMALANETLRQHMENAPPEHFDIESVKDAEKIIEMDVALVELEDSDSSEEEESSDDSSSDEEETVCVEKLKLPGNEKRKANIQVLEREGE